MRYYIRNGSLFLRGHFRAAGTGSPGGFRHVPTIVVHGPLPPGEGADSLRALERAVQREGLSPDIFGVPAGPLPSRLCILQYDSLMVFIAPGPAGGFSIVVYSGEGLSDAALLGALVTATAARMAVLCERDVPGTPGIPQDTFVVACEGVVVHEDASPPSAIGSRIGEAVRFGTGKVLAARDGQPPRGRPSFFIFSRYQGDHWVEWVPEECPYYPCHFPGQRCDFCYCPLYPCGDEELGQWVKSSTANGLVWNCSTCTLLHEPAIADYLLLHPEASLAELKAKRRREKK
ncbi:MAG: adenosylcobinamide amidohydrolase [Methanolinea sp.]|nr:adenosylcobinamide amidohydrolase [Methanolinea sp.]